MLPLGLVALALQSSPLAGRLFALTLQLDHHPSFDRFEAQQRDTISLRLLTIRLEGLFEELARLLTLLRPLPALLRVQAKILRRRCRVGTLSCRVGALLCPGVPLMSCVGPLSLGIGALLCRIDAPPDVSTTFERLLIGCCSPPGLVRVHHDPTP